MSYCDKQRGFTLLEVMVALAILAVVAVSASQASRSYLQSVDNMKTRTLAYFVAQNTLSDLRIQRAWLTGSNTKQIEAQGRQWQVTTSVMSNDTAERLNMVQKVSISVAPIFDGLAKNSIVSLDAVLVKPMESHP